jgi:hypothetical protein
VHRVRRSHYPADRAEGKQAGPEILVIASRQDATTARAEAHDPGHVLRREAITRVDREEPELVEVEGVERAQRRVVLADVTIAGGHVVTSAA